MPTRFLARQANITDLTAQADAAPIYVDSDDNIAKMVPAGSGSTEVQIIDASSVQTLTNKTLTAPTIAGVINSDIKVLAADATATSNVVLTTLTGFSWTVIAGKTYRFRARLFTTMTTNGGLSLALKYTTATLTSIKAKTYAATDTDNTTGVSTQSTTTTDQTKFFDSKAAAYTCVELEGTLVVNAAGSIALQICQNTSHIDTTTILLGSFAELVRVN